MDSTLLHEIDDALALVDAAARSGGEIVQLPDGRAAYRTGLKNSDAGDTNGYKTDGVIWVTKPTTFVGLPGLPLFWDRSANTSSYKQDANSGDFFLGTIVRDAAASDTQIAVALNVRKRPLIEWGQGAWDSVAVVTSGLVIPNPATGITGTDPAGKRSRFTFSATAEAQKVDAMSVQSIPVTVPFIARIRMAIFSIGDNSALDINVGLANGTHATDADAITESLFVHLDGNALDIKLESDDGTTEVAATDSTIDAVDDTFFEVWVDGRNLSDIQVYIAGALVLPDSVFKLNAATGPLKALVHLEKTSDDTVADVRIEEFDVHTLEVEAA